jgi:hypothetical protein
LGGASSSNGALRRYGSSELGTFSTTKPSTGSESVHVTLVGFNEMDGTAGGKGSGAVMSRSKP